MTDASHRQIERRLRAHFDSLQHQTPYEIFGVWEGCGPVIVKRHYIELVKKNHPDRYGGNITPAIKELSQQIFLSIQKAKRHLDRAEQIEISSHPPAQGSSSVPSESSVANQELGAIRSEPSAVLEVETQSTRSADSLTEDERPTSEARRALLAKLARGQSEAGGGGAIPMADEAISLSTPEELLQRRAALNMLARKNQTATSVPSLGERRQALRASAEHVKVSRASDAPSASALPTQGIKDQTLSDAKTLFREGFAHFKRKEYQFAQPKFERALETEPEDPVTQTFMAYTLFMCNRLEGVKPALQLLEKAISSESRQALPDAYLFKGFILRHQAGRLNEAYECFRMVLKFNPNSREARREIENMKKRSQRSRSEKSDKPEKKPVSFATEEKLAEDSAASFMSRFFSKK